MFSLRLALVFVAVAVVLVSAGVVEETPTGFNGTDEVMGMQRRDCDCTTSGGRCMHTGDYQCFFNDGARIVECDQAGKWTLVSKCDGTCKTLHNDRPYCL